MKYLVIIDGPGDTSSEFYVVAREAKTPRAALDAVLDDGYGQDQDGVAFVARLDQVATFSINETRARQARPTNFEAIVAALPPALAHFLDPDNDEYPCIPWGEMMSTLRFKLMVALRLSVKNETGKLQYVYRLGRKIPVPPGHWVGFSGDDGMEGY